MFLRWVHPALVPVVLLAQAAPGASYWTRPWTTEDGLPQNTVTHLAQTLDGYPWIGTRLGLARLDCVHYGTGDGLASSEGNGEHQPSAARARDGRLWFPTTRGVVVLDPAEMIGTDVVPPVLIEEVIADGEAVWSDGAESGREGQGAGFVAAHPVSSVLRLPPGRARLLEIRFTANSFGAPDKVRFRYRLDGVDRDWRDAGARRFAHYTNLRPGHYRFEVKAANHHGLWNERPAAFAFSLAPHAWQTWPFWAACAAGAALLVWAFHQRRINFLRRLERLERAQAVDAERTRIARDLHDDLGANLTGLALKLDLARRQFADRPMASQLAPLALEARSSWTRASKYPATPTPAPASSCNCPSGSFSRRAHEHQGLTCGGQRGHPPEPGGNAPSLNRVPAR